MSKIKLLCFSDTHGSDKLMLEALAEHPDAEYIIHLGDGLADLDALPIGNRTLLTVNGNHEDYMDGFRGTSGAPVERKLTLGGVTLLLMHGHRQYVKSNPLSALEYAYTKGADVLIYGHTHARENHTVHKGGMLRSITASRDITAFNPGSAGSRLLSSSPSYGIIVIDNGRLELSHIK